MKINKILLGMIVIELIIIIVSPMYLKLKYPTVFQKHKPSVLVIDIFGEVYSLNYPFSKDFVENNKNTLSATEIVQILKKFENDTDVKAFILNIDSNGGDGVGQGELVNQIHSMKKSVVAVVRDQALSSGYYVASATKRIFANELSNIADIGISSIIDYKPRGTKIWRTCYISSSPIKIMYQDDCPGIDIVQYENERLRLKKATKQMSSEIANFRNLPAPYVLQFSDGTIFKGNEALKIKLIDEIGGIHEAVDYLEKDTWTNLDIVYWRELKFAYDKDNN